MKCWDSNFKRPANIEKDGNLLHLAVEGFFDILWVS